MAKKTEEVKKVIAPKKAKHVEVEIPPVVTGHSLVEVQQKVQDATIPELKKFLSDVAGYLPYPQDVNEVKNQIRALKLIEELPGSEDEARVWLHELANTHYSVLWIR